MEGDSSNSSTTTSPTASSVKNSKQTQIASLEKSIEKVNEEIIKLKSEGTEKTSHTSQNSSIRQNTQATADTDNDLQKKIGDAYTTEISAEGYNALTNSQTNSINNFY